MTHGLRRWSLSLQQSRMACGSVLAREWGSFLPTSDQKAEKRGYEPSWLLPFSPFIQSEPQCTVIPLQLILSGKTRTDIPKSMSLMSPTTPLSNQVDSHINHNRLDFFLSTSTILPFSTVIS